MHENEEVKNIIKPVQAVALAIYPESPGMDARVTVVRHEVEAEMQPYGQVDSVM